MHVDAYDFGSIVIDGRTYRSDLLIWPGQLKSDWWRAEGHLLQLPDLEEALAAEPQVLVVGTGAYGNMAVGPELVSYLQAKGIELLAQPTREACQILNKLGGKRRLAAALHLTC
ncbi:MAG: MTH938/NDUFAF3 family protein [Deltaproteobacteria bacterium]|nr:MTH938/NDUFAF3 family protein [Deltaproteobacteria bacterium]